MGFQETVQVGALDTDFPAELGEGNPSFVPVLLELFGRYTEYLTYLFRCQIGVTLKGSGSGREPGLDFIEDFLLELPQVIRSKS